MSEKKPNTYETKLDGKTCRVTIPGQVQQEGPASEQEMETFVEEAVEAYAETSDMPRADVRTFAEDGILTRNKGLVVTIGDVTFQITIVRSR